MSPTKKEVKDWLKRSGRNREWLGQQCGGVTERAVNNWLSTDRPIPAASLEIIRRLMEDDARAEAARKATETPSLSHVTLRITTDELNEWSKAFKSSNAETLEDWALQMIREAYRSEHLSSHLTDAEIIGMAAEMQNRDRQSPRSSDE